MNAEWEQAVRQGRADTLERLLTTGFDINARDAQGQTALMIAARLGHDSAVALLCERGAGLDYTAKFQLTALMLAVVNNHVSVAQQLVRAGADLAIRGTGAPGFSGKTALDLAVAAGHHELAAMLRAAAREGQPPT
jgi:ankyrin repeat protein